MIMHRFHFSSVLVIFLPPPPTFILVQPLHMSIPKPQEFSQRRWLWSCYEEAATMWGCAIFPCLCTKLSCSIAFLPYLLGYISHIVQRRPCCVSHFSSCFHLAQCFPVPFLWLLHFSTLKDRSAKYLVSIPLSHCYLSFWWFQSWSTISVCPSLWGQQFSQLYGTISSVLHKPSAHILQSFPIHFNWCILLAFNKILVFTDFWNMV